MYATGCSSARGARSSGERAGKRGGEGGGAHQESIPMIDLGGGEPEKRINAKGRSSGGTPMAVGDRAVDSCRGKLERGSWRCGGGAGRGWEGPRRRDRRTAAEDGRGAVGGEHSSARHVPSWRRKKEMREKRVQGRVFIDTQPPGPEYPDIIPECPGRSGLSGHISGLSGPNQFQGDKI